MKAKILIVDDSKTDMIIIQNMLNDYQPLCAYDGFEAMTMIEQQGDIDLIILDLNMPRMDGFEVLKALQMNPLYTKIPTLILTNYDETENEVKGLDLGAVDYIRKPLNMESLRKRIEVHLNLRNGRQCVEEANLVLEEIVNRRTKELVLSRDITIHALIGLLEVRNAESSNHTIRTQWMMKTLCEYLSTKPEYEQILTKEYVEELFKTAPLHDIGKVGIPDNILLKPGKLDREEFEIIKKHTTYGVEALSYNLKDAQEVTFIHTAIEIVRTHHEKYDGTGYPAGLKGEEIPLCGRIMAIVDVYDALVSKRVYKASFTHKEALDIIKNEQGKHFDPVIVDAFMEIEQKILEIAKQYLQCH